MVVDLALPRQEPCLSCTPRPKQPACHGDNLAIIMLLQALVTLHRLARTLHSTS